MTTNPLQKETPERDTRMISALQQVLTPGLMNRAGIRGEDDSIGIVSTGTGAASDNSPAPCGKRRILIVDDESHIRDSVGFVLETAGHDVAQVENGAQALDTVIASGKKGEPFDLLLTDIQMPVLGGLDLIDALIERGISIPAMVITGNGGKDSAVEFMRRGCFDYLEKPLSPGSVLDRVHAALGRINRSRTARPEAGDGAERMETELAAYRSSFELLEGEVAKASDAVQQILSIDCTACRAPLHFRRDTRCGCWGDFIDFRNTSTGCDVFVACGAGNDLAASYYGILFKAFFEENHRQGRRGPEFLRLLNAQLINKTLSRRAFGAAYLRFNFRSRLCEIAAAGAPALYRVRGAMGRAVRVDVRGTMLGGDADGHFETRVFKMEPGDRLFWLNGEPDRAAGWQEDFAGHLATQPAGEHHESIKATINRAWHVCHAPEMENPLITLLGIEVPAPY